MPDPSPKPSNLSWLNLIGVLLVASVQGLSMLFGPAVTPLPEVERWYVTKSGEVVDAPAIIAVADKLEDGSYTLIGYPKSGKITQRSVTVGDGTPAPIPVPPKPVDPPAPIPPVVDSFEQSVKAAYASETAKDKAALLSGLISGYRQAEQVASDSSLTTVGKLYMESRKAVISQAGFVGLAKVREAIANELNSILPTDGSVVITPEIRSKIIAQYARARKAMEAAQ